MRRTHVHLTEKQWGRLQSLAGDTGLNVSEHVRRAIDNYLDEVESKKENTEDKAVESGKPRQ